MIIQFYEDELDAQRHAAWGKILNQYDHAKFVTEYFNGCYMLADDWHRGIGYPYPTEPTEPDGTWGGHWPLRGGHPGKGQNVVYVLRTALGDPLYAGSTNHFSARLRRHKRAGKDWQAWTASPHPTREAAYQAEAIYIDQHRPPLNLVYPRCERASA